MWWPTRYWWNILTAKMILTAIFLTTSVSIWAYSFCGGHCSGSKTDGSLPAAPCGTEEPQCHKARHYRPVLGISSPHNALTPYQLATTVSTESKPFCACTRSVSNILCAPFFTVMAYSSAELTSLWVVLATVSVARSIIFWLFSLWCLLKGWVVSYVEDILPRRWFMLLWAK